MAIPELLNWKSSGGQYLDFKISNQYNAQKRNDSITNNYDDVFDFKTNRSRR